MKAFQKGPVLILISLFLSVLLHAAMITGVSSVQVLGAGLFSPKFFFADLVREGSYGTSPLGYSGKSRGRYSKGDPSGKGAGKNQDNALKEGDGTKQRRAKEDATQGVTSGEDVAAENDDQEKGEGDLKTETSVTDEIAEPTVLHEEGRPEPARISNYPLNYSREKISFDIYWLGIYVGKAVLEAVNDAGTVKITSQIHSAPFISAFYKVEDYAESQLIKGMPSHFRIKQWEGRYRSDKETIFDMDGGKVIFFNYLKGTRAEHDIANSVLWDVISGFYFLRTQVFEVGKTVYIDIFDSNKFLKAEVNVIRKEKVKFAGKGETEAVVVKPVLKSEGLFQNKGDILVWLTDDENKIPVRVETRVSIGTVTAELKQVETEREGR